MMSELESLTTVLCRTEVCDVAAVLASLPSHEAQDKMMTPSAQAKALVRELVEAKMLLCEAAAWIRKPSPSGTGREDLLARLDRAAR